jgi:hypothetical protein
MVSALEQHNIRQLGSCFSGSLDIALCFLAMYCDVAQWYLGAVHYRIVSCNCSLIVAVFPDKIRSQLWLDSEQVVAAIPGPDQSTRLALNFQNVGTSAKFTFEQEQNLTRLQVVNSARSYNDPDKET